MVRETWKMMCRKFEQSMENNIKENDIWNWESQWLDWDAVNEGEKFYQIADVAFSSDYMLKR